MAVTRSLSLREHDAQHRPDPISCVLITVHRIHSLEFMALIPAWGTQLKCELVLEWEIQSWDTLSPLNLKKLKVAHGSNSDSREAGARGLPWGTTGRLQVTVTGTGDWQWGTEPPWTLWWVYWLVRPHPTRVSFRTYSEFQLTVYLKVMRLINFPKRKFTSSEIAWKSIFNRVRNAEENKSLENGEDSSVVADGKYRTDHWYSYCKDKWWPTKQSIYYLCVWNL